MDNDVYYPNKDNARDNNTKMDRDFDRGRGRRGRGGRGGRGKFTDKVLLFLVKLIPKKIIFNLLIRN